MFGLGTKELIILAGIFLLFFGASRIPELARSLKSVIRELRGIFSAAGENKD